MKKEVHEWIHSWCDETLSEDLPRVLLVGDSITHGYQSQVRELLKGKAYVDYFSTSYGIDNPLYNTIIKSFYTNSKYDIIHFNHGLHAWHLSAKTYKNLIVKLLKKLNCKNTIVANSTVVYLKGNTEINQGAQNVIEKRNTAVEEIAQENGYLYNDLHSVSRAIPLNLRTEEGIHYVEEGSLYLAKQVVEKIEKILKGE